MPEKSTPFNARLELTSQLDWEIRQLTTANVISASAIAQRVGMNSSDLHCAEILVRMGPMSAGRLAELSGLTTGAITGVVDRLERAGWAKREADRDDRRKVVIHALPQDSPATQGLYDPYLEAISRLLDAYSDQELVFILDFVKRLTAVTNETAAKIRSSA